MNKTRSIKYTIFDYLISKGYTENDLYLNEEGVFDYWWLSFQQPGHHRKGSNTKKT